MSLSQKVQLVLFEPTYEELKWYKVFKSASVNSLFEPTYEELKFSRFSPQALLMRRLSLPMRN